MSSKAELAKWLARHRELVREIDPDPADTTAKLVLARRNLERARAHGVADPDFALVAAESALVNIADAVLAGHGFRLRGKTGSHEARFSFPGLPSGFRAHSALIAAARKSRNMAMYDTAGGVSASFVEEVTGIVSELLKDARRR
ncbi:MAG: hypothetical protein ACRDM0_04770 [Thermoleophilaceae bacterium]